jgi:hypothetical protein
MVTSPKRLGPWKDYAGEGQQHIRKTDPSSRQRGRPTKQDCNCQGVINIWSWAPDGTRHQDLLIDWPSVAMWLWLWLWLWLWIVEFCTGGCEERTWASETEDSPLLEAVARERRVRAQQAGKRLSGCCGVLWIMKFNVGAVIACSSESCL